MDSLLRPVELTPDVAACELTVDATVPQSVPHERELQRTGSTVSLQWETVESF